MSLNLHGSSGGGCCIGFAFAAIVVLLVVGVLVLIEFLGERAFTALGI